MESKQEMMGTSAITLNVIVILYAVFILPIPSITNMKGLLSIVTIIICPLLTTMELVRRKMNKSTLTLIRIPLRILNTVFSITINKIVIGLNAFLIIVYLSLMIRIFGTKYLSFTLTLILISSFNLFVLFFTQIKDQKYIEGNGRKGHELK